MLKIFVSSILFAFAGMANAYDLSVFKDTDQCELARIAGKAKGYTPTTNAPFKGGKGWVKKVVPAGGACLGEAHVLEDGAPKNGMSVFVEEGFVYWHHAATNSFRMNDCSNPFGSIRLVYDKNVVDTVTPDEPIVVTAPAQTVVQIAETFKKEITLDETFYCTIHGGARQLATIQNGQPVCPEVKVTASIVVDEPIRVQPHVIPGPRTVAVEPVTKESCGDTCNQSPKFTLTGSTARTDGRCVIHITFQGGDRFIRLSPEKGTGRLMAAIVKNATGEFDRTLPLVYVGDDEKTFHANPTCKASFQEFTGGRSYAPTIRRLKLDNCVLRGLV